MSCMSRPSATATATASAISAASRQKLDYLQDLGITAIWLLPFYPSPLRDDGYDIADYRGIHPDYGTLRGLPTLRPGGPPARTAGHHRTGDQPYLGPASLVSGEPGGAKAGSPARNYYVWSDTGPNITEARIIFTDYRILQLDLGPGGRGLLLAPILLPPARPEFRQSPRCVKAVLRGHAISGSTWGWTACGSTQCPISSSGKGPTARTCRRPTQFLKKLRAIVDRNYADRMFLAEANQWPEDVRGLFRRRRRVPHGLSFSADAAHVHGPAAWRTATPSSTSWSRRRPFPTAANGRCFCAITTS